MASIGSVAFNLRISKTSLYFHSTGTCDDIALCSTSAYNNDYNYNYVVITAMKRSLHQTCFFRSYSQHDQGHRYKSKVHSWC